MQLIANNQYNCPDTMQLVDVVRAQASGLNRELAIEIEYRNLTVVTRHPEQCNNVAFLLEAGLNHALHVFDQSKHSDYGRW